MPLLFCDKGGYDDNGGWGEARRLSRPVGHCNLSDFFFFFFCLSFSFSFSGTTRVHTDRLTDSLAVQVHTCAHMSVKKMFASQKGGDAPSPDESGLGSRTLAAPCD